MISANLRHYRNVEGFDRSFKDVIISALDHLEQQVMDGRSHFIIADDKGCRVGCIFFSPEDEVSGRVRLFFLTEAYRGHGVGKRMLNQVIEHACQKEFETIRVSTFEQHRDACGLYAATGFKGKVGEPMEAFGRVTRQVDFEYDLSPQSITLGQ
ncbi:GNAT family N-acetyltransferase [Roseovarius aestuarii]|uniref:Spermine/spermidine acetyltransferase n=1 Tax=Roseovarius aestuarii TaxID=475083 RepID=A0A1X7BWV9_9RHOB|nr:GNAT family N-acetyltransferase [Roseovarius aestuarii]SMC14113.1 Spermine/spermidine acetyltransferase [Roseovarius aestuarii]